jgi:tetratricopeptide (TPR) repeat protein
MGGQQLTDKQREILDQQLTVDPRRISDQAPSLKYKQFNDEKSLQSYLRNNIDNDYLQQAETQIEETQTESEQPEGFYENIEQQILLLDKQLQELTQQELTPKTQESRTFESESSGEESTENQNSQRDSIEELGLSPYRTESVIGTENKLATYMELKSAQLILEGDDWLSQQKFYRASDSYTSALIYKEDPRAYAGKCHALFGAGEYMSSSFFLFLAIEADPGYVELEMDIITAMGGRDILDNRLVDVENWAQESDSADLHFLRAYFYYRIGRLDMAGEAINIALEKMPDSAALATLKKAIDKKS